MATDKFIALPQFALPLFYNHNRCRSCGIQVNEGDVQSAGVGRDKDGSLCFTFEYRCPACGTTRTVIDAELRITKHYWWDEIAERDYDAENIDYVFYFAAETWRNLPKIGPMVVRGDYPGRVWIRGGYKGDVGPVIFLFTGVDVPSFFGSMRLERGHHVSLLKHEDTSQLPWLKTTEFAQVKDGFTFALDGKNWIKMSAAEIEEIIRDQAFDLTTDENDTVITRLPKTRSAHIKKGRKGTRRPPRHPRPLDS